MSARNTRIWVELNQGNSFGPGLNWAGLGGDNLIEGTSLEYGITGNRPSDCLAGSGTLRFSLNNSASNSGGVVGYYSPYHASKRPGWGPGVQVLLWIEGLTTGSVSSMSRSGSTVTVDTSAAHGLYTGAEVRFEGANQQEYNFVFFITVTSATQFTFTITGTPTTPATGTITWLHGRIRFWGRIDTIDVEPGPFGPRRVHVTAYDRMRDLIDADLANVALQVNQTESQVMSAVFAALDSSVAPLSQGLDTGIDQIPYALDDIGDGTKAASVLGDILRSSYGLGWVFGPGTFLYKSRNFRATATSAGTFSSTMQGFSAAGSISNAYNQIKVTTHPRSIDASNVVLWAATGTPPLVPGSNASTPLIIEAAFRDPSDATRLIGAASTVSLASGTDYSANSQADGAGTDLTSSITITPTVRASRVTFSIVNASATPAYLVTGTGATLLQIRGKGLYDQAPRTFPAGSTQSYGVRPFRLDLPYQNVDATGQQIADFILDQYDTLGTQIDSVTLKAHPDSPNSLYASAVIFEVSNVVTLSETVTGVSSVDAMILGVRMNWLSNTAIECTWLLGPKITLSAPSTPTSITIANLSDGDFRVSWSTGTAGSYTQVYIDSVYRGTAGIGATSFDVNNLTRATNYSVTVRHMYFGMPSAFSSPVIGRPVVAATGGTTSTPGDGYKYHTFTSSGNFVMSIPGRIDWQVIAGGGCGNYTYAPGNIYGGGGGGAGGVVTSIDDSEPAGTHAIVIGAGANPNGGDLAADVNGGNSSYRTTTATGGGRGGSNNSGGGGFAGSSGGSGGGGGPLNTAGGSGTGSQGNAGGAATNIGGNNTGGSGGGATAAGGTGDATTGAAGGAGISCLDGVTRARGGDGGGITVNTLGAGAANTGNGGSGGQNGTNGYNSILNNGFSGGSGICILRYPI